MTITLKKINNRLKNIKRNTTKIIIILTTYVAIAKTNTQFDVDATTIIIASYNNINQRRQLKKTKREKTMIFKIKKQREKNSLRALFVKKLIKRLQRAEKTKENVMIARRLLNENVELMTRSKKIRNRSTINNSLLKHVTLSTYAVFKTFDVLAYDVRVVDVQTKNQQKIIKRIKKQNEILHSSLQIARMTRSKNVVNNEKKLSSLIVKIYSAEQIDRLIKDDLLHEYTQIICELFVNNCRIKQCFNCQRYEHIDKICRYERRCSICFELHSDFTCKVTIDKRKCANCENNHSIWFFQCKIRMIKKNRIFDIWRTKSILYSTNFKDISRATFNKLDVVIQQTLTRSVITSSTSSFCFSIEEILIQKEIEILKNIMHLKIENYTINEITEKRTLSQNSERSMSLSFCQRSISVVQIINNQLNNAFDVLKNHSSTRTSQNTTQDTQLQHQF
jgi:hypothetical protein